MTPLKKESLHSYAERMLNRIDTSKPFSLLGTSFGGIIAIEMYKIHKPEQLILISAPKNKEELNWFMKLGWGRDIMHFVPTFAIRNFLKYGYSTLTKTIPKFKSLAHDNLKDMVWSIDGKFDKWAMKQIIDWDNKTTLRDYIQLIVDDDVLFPVKNFNATHIIKGGTHGMLINHHEEINQHINEFLNHK